MLKCVETSNKIYAWFTVSWFFSRKKILISKCTLVSLTKRCPKIWCSISNFNLIYFKLISNNGVLILSLKKATVPRPSQRRCPVKNLLLKMLQNLQKKTCVRASILNKVEGLNLQLYFKKDSDAGVFLWILRSF